MIKIIDYLLWHGNQQKWVSTPSKWVSTLPKWVSTPPKMGVNTSKMGLNRHRRCSHGVLTDCSCTKRVAQQSRFPSQIRVISVISFSQLTLREENGTLNKALRGRIWPKTKLASMFVRQTLLGKEALCGKSPSQAKLVLNVWLPAVHTSANLSRCRFPRTMLCVALAPSL